MAISRQVRSFPAPNRKRKMTDDIKKLQCTSFDSHAHRLVVDHLQTLGLPLAPHRAWSTYGGDVVINGYAVRFDGTDDERAALEDRVHAAQSEEDTFVVCVPKVPHYVGRIAASFTAGFTVVDGGNKSLYRYQNVIYADLDDGSITVIADTPAAKYVVVAVRNVSAWDMDPARKAHLRIVH
jgi:hypothetical protein